MTDAASMLDTDTQEILRLHREFVDANGPLDSTYLRNRVVSGPDEMIWFNLNGSIYTGVDHIAQLWDMLASIMAGEAMSSELRDEHVHVVGDCAWVTYLNHYRADFGNLGSFNAGMRGTEIWRRDNGMWQLVHVHFSTHVPNQMGGH
ncbi:YybH family protein [Nocardia araoensis]|uniref:YybH family protein n=1 Tax=Nocardia araoensis TaxID=228600 RepID=UPI000684D758|nr:nuclear transport factor 2 family protein [Nocardia araoensis]